MLKAGDEFTLTMPRSIAHDIGLEWILSHGLTYVAQEIDDNRIWFMYDELRWWTPAKWAKPVCGCMFDA